MANNNLTPDVLAAYGASDLTPDQRAALNAYFGVNLAGLPDDTNQFTTGYDLAAYLSERGDQATRAKLDNILGYYNDTLKGVPVETRRSTEFDSELGDTRDAWEYLNPITQSWMQGDLKTQGPESYDGEWSQDPYAHITGLTGVGRGNIHTPQGGGRVINTGFDLSRGDDGNYTFGGVNRVYGDDSTTFVDDYLPFLMLAAPFGAAIAGAGTAGAGLGGSGAFLGEAPWSATGGGALDFGGTAAGGAGGSGAFLGEGAASGIPAWDAASAAAGLPLPGAGAVGSGLSLLDGASKWLGPAATALGALAGSQGQDTSQTSVKSMDPRMDKLFYEDLAPRIQGLLAKQMAPGAMQGFTDMQSVGRNLLNQPVAGNGFNRFFPGR